MASFLSFSHRLDSMLPIVHFVTGIVLAGMFWPFIGYPAILILVGSFLIDVDHYLYWLAYFRKTSLKENYWWHRLDKSRDELHVFHTVEIWTALVIGSFYSYLALLFSIGLFFHMILDFLEMYFINDLFGRRAISAIAWMIRRR